jgi:hypothetical protein
MLAKELLECIDLRPLCEIAGRERLIDQLLGLTGDEDFEERYHGAEIRGR